MQLLKIFIGAMIGVVLFMYLWPLLVILIVVLLVYWVVFLRRVRKAADSVYTQAQEEFHDARQDDDIETPVQQGDVIDAQYTERDN